MHPDSCSRDSFSKNSSAIARKFCFTNKTVISRRFLENCWEIQGFANVSVGWGYNVAELQRNRPIRGFKNQVRVTSLVGKLLRKRPRGEAFPKRLSVSKPSCIFPSNDSVSGLLMEYFSMSIAMLIAQKWFLNLVIAFQSRLHRTHENVVVCSKITGWAL